MKTRNGPTDGRTDRRTDRPTDRPTDKPCYRDARTYLKTKKAISFPRYARGSHIFPGKCVLSNHSISNHFAGSISKQHLRTTLILPNIQPFCGKYRQIIQPFHLISTSKDILPLLLYPTGFQRYPTIWNDSNPYPTIAGLSNHFSKLSNHLDQIKTISNHFRFIQPLSNCLDRFKPISNRFRFIQPFL